MLDNQGLEWIKQAYLVSLVGGFVFLAVLEGGTSPLAPAIRVRHILRNVAMFALVILIADILVLGMVFETPSRLTESDGLLTPLGLSPGVVFIMGFVLLDFIAYGFHRACHRWTWLWRMHAVHHSDTHLDASTGLRNHPFEVTLSVILTVAFCLGTGIPMWVEGARAIFANPWAMFQHANIARVRWLEQHLRGILSTPDIHKIHHSTDAREINANYGVVFSVWDRLFGTYLEPGPNPVHAYGLTTMTEGHWQTVNGMMLTPLKGHHLQAPLAR